MRQDSFFNGLSDCYVSILCIFRILFHSIITLVYRSLQDSLMLDCYVSISRTFRILFHQIVTLVYRTLLGFFFIRLLRQYLIHFQDSLSFDCYVSISRTFMILSLNCYFRLSYKLRCYIRISSPAKKNYHIFHVRLISQISCRHVTRLRRHPVRLMKEGQSLHHSAQSLIVCWNFLGLWLLKQ